MKKLVAKLFIALVVVSGVPGLGLANTNLETESATNTAGNVYRLPANSINTHRVWLNRGHADVTIDGDGDTDLDLYILDGDGSVAIRREGTSDYESACLDVPRSGYYIVKIVNRGRVHNDYQLTVE